MSNKITLYDKSYHLLSINYIIIVLCTNLYNVYNLYNLYKLYKLYKLYNQYINYIISI